MNAIKMQDVNETYRGKTGCACGCGGDYATTEENANSVKRRVNFINKNIGSPSLIVDTYEDETIYELENASGSRVTRVYVKTEVK